MRFKHEGFKVGQTVRAYDFKPREGVGDCYVEGRITEVNTDGSPAYPFAHYVVETYRDVFDGRDITNEDSRIGTHTIVPMEMLILEWGGRVVEVK